MKPLDTINTSATWNVGAIVAFLGIVGAVLSNPQVMAELAVILSNAPLPTKAAAVGILLGLLATIVGKPPATSSATKGS